MKNMRAYRVCDEIKRAGIRSTHTCLSVFNCLEIDPFFDILDRFLHGKAEHLFHGIAFADGYDALFQRVEIDRYAEGSADLVLTAVTFADRTRNVVRILRLLFLKGFSAKEAPRICRAQGRGAISTPYARRFSRDRPPLRRMRP